MKKFVHSVFKAYIRHFPIQKGKARLVRRLWRLVAFGQFHRSTWLKDARVKLNCDLTQYLQRHLYFFGEYEAEHCRRWSHLAAKSSVIFDVGANVGLYSLIAAAANHSAKIHAFEPTPEIYDLLCENIKSNSFSNVLPHLNAVAAKNGKARLVRQGGDNEGMNYIQTCSSSTAETENGDFAIATISLDEFCRESKIDQIDLLKMDCEGGEFNVLQGAQQLLSENKIRCILLELAEATSRQGGHTTKEVAALLTRSGYDLFKLVRGKLIPLKLNTRQSGNVWALPKKSRSEIQG